MSNHKNQPVRGCKDLFGNDIIIFNFIVETARKLAVKYGFKELQTPIFEFSEIFERNLGETSDVISKEVYKFLDRGDNYLTLRPEFTAAIVRALISNSELNQNLPAKFFSFGALFRYDRPQKGRQRQFHQINFENFGIDSVFCDVENLILAKSILDQIGISDKAKLIINSLGSIATKNLFQQELQNYFNKFYNDLSPDSQKRLAKNALRILDSKDDKDIEIARSAPKISSFFNIVEKARFEKLQELLTDYKIDFTIEENLVRGLDYYTSTVFEFINNHQGAQNTILAGGRYDNLVSQMGFTNTAAFGFAAGIERLANLMIENIKEANQIIENDSPIIITFINHKQQSFAFKIANMLRSGGIPAIILFSNEEKNNNHFKKQLKFASNNQAEWVIIIGEDEEKSNEIVVKNFTSSSEEKIKADASTLNNFFTEKRTKLQFLNDKVTGQNNANWTNENT
jgi:histidyl-tRNA synthetase